MQPPLTAAPCQQCLLGRWHLWPWSMQVDLPCATTTLLTTLRHRVRHIQVDRIAQDPQHRVLSIGLQPESAPQASNLAGAQPAFDFASQDTCSNYRACGSGAPALEQICFPNHESANMNFIHDGSGGLHSSGKALPHKPRAATGCCAVWSCSCQWRCC